MWQSEISQKLLKICCRLEGKAKKKRAWRLLVFPTLTLFFSLSATKFSVENLFPSGYRNVSNTTQQKAEKKQSSPLIDFLIVACLQASLASQMFCCSLAKAIHWISIEELSIFSRCVEHANRHHLMTIMFVHRSDSALKILIAFAIHRTFYTSCGMGLAKGDFLSVSTAVCVCGRKNFITLSSCVIFFA